MSTTKIAPAASATPPVAPAVGTPPASKAGDAVPPPAEGTPPAEPTKKPALGDDVPAVGKPALGDALAEGDDVPAGGKPKSEAPINYDFGAPPEGQSPYRAPMLDAYKTVLGKHKVAPDVAKDILQTMVPALQQDYHAQLREQNDKFAAQWEQDLVQQHGEQRDTVVRRANSALHRLAPTLAQTVKGTALASHPGLINLLAFIDQRTTNDRPPKATESSPGKPLDALDQLAAQYDEDARKRDAAQRGQ